MTIGKFAKRFFYTCAIFAALLVLAIGTGWWAIQTHHIHNVVAFGFITTVGLFFLVPLIMIFVVIALMVFLYRKYREKTSPAR